MEHHAALYRTTTQNTIATTSSASSSRTVRPNAPRDSMMSGMSNVTYGADAFEGDDAISVAHFGEYASSTYGAPTFPPVPARSSSLGNSVLSQRGRMTTIHPMAHSVLPEEVPQPRDTELMEERRSRSRSFSEVEDDESEIERQREFDEAKKLRAREKGRERQRRKRERDKQAREEAKYADQMQAPGGQLGTSAPQQHIQSTQQPQHPHVTPIVVPPSFPYNLASPNTPMTAISGASSPRGLVSPGLSTPGSTYSGSLWGDESSTSSQELSANFGPSSYPGPSGTFTNIPRPTSGLDIKPSKRRRSESKPDVFKPSSVGSISSNTSSDRPGIPRTISDSSSLNAAPPIHPEQTHQTRVRSEASEHFAATVLLGLTKSGLRPSLEQSLALGDNGLEEMREDLAIVFERWRARRSRRGIRSAQTVLEQGMQRVTIAPNTGVPDNGHRMPPSPNPDQAIYYSQASVIQPLSRPQSQDGYSQQGMGGAALPQVVSSSHPLRQIVTHRALGPNLPYKPYSVTFESTNGQWPTQPQSYSTSVGNGYPSTMATSRPTSSSSVQMGNQPAPGYTYVSNPSAQQGHANQQPALAMPSITHYTTVPGNSNTPAIYHFSYSQPGPPAALNQGETP